MSDNVIDPAYEIRFHDDIGFAVAYTYHRHYMNVWCVEIIAVDLEGKRLFNRQGYRGSGEYVQDILGAQVYLGGSIKWDGCSNWYFVEQDHVALHFCSTGQAMNIGCLLGRIYSLAAELMDADGQHHMIDEVSVL